MMWIVVMSLLPMPSNPNAREDTVGTTEAANNSADPPDTTGKLTEVQVQLMISPDPDLMHTTSIFRSYLLDSCSCIERRASLAETLLSNWSRMD